jgi:transposase-like protein
MPPVDRKNPVRSKSSDSQYSLMEFMREFPDDDACLDWLWRERYSPDGKHADCPKCKREHVPFKHYKTKQRRQTWTCTKCGHHVQPTAGTIFEGSSTSLHLWFYALHLMTSTRCGISAKQLERELGVTYKTAWRIFNRIRNELMSDGGDGPLSGDVEIDETSIEGRPRIHMDRSAAARLRERSRATVLGMVERGGRVRFASAPVASWPRSDADSTRQRCLHLAYLHRRLACVQAALARIRGTLDRAALGPRLRHRRRAHEHSRGVLREPQDLDSRDVQARIPAMAPVLLGRVRVALQPSPRLPGDVPAATSAGGAWLSACWRPS